MKFVNTEAALYRCLFRIRSIAVYYYTKNTNGHVDFEGDLAHNTVWYPQIKV